MLLEPTLGSFHRTWLPAHLHKLRQLYHGSNIVHYLSHILLFSCPPAVDSHPVPPPLTSDNITPS